MRKFRRVLFLKLARMMRGEKNIVPCIISAGTRIVGNITDGDVIHIDGRLDGDVSCRELVIGSTGAVTGKFRRKVWNFTANLMARWQWKTCLSPVRHGLSATRYIRRLRLNRAQCWKENARFPKEMQRRLRIRKPVPARSSRQAGKRERVPKAACGWPTGRRKQVLATSRRPAGRRKQVSATGRRPTEGRETPG